MIYALNQPPTPHFMVSWVELLQKSLGIWTVMETLQWTIQMIVLFSASYFAIALLLPFYPALHMPFSNFVADHQPTSSTSLTPWCRWETRPQSINVSNSPQVLCSELFLALPLICCNCWQMHGDQPFGLDGGIQDGSYRIAQGDKGLRLACMYLVLAWPSIMCS